MENSLGQSTLSNIFNLKFLNAGPSLLAGCNQPWLASQGSSKLVMKPICAPLDHTWDMSIKRLRTERTAGFGLTGCVAFPGCHGKKSKDSFTQGQNVNFSHD